MKFAALLACLSPVFSFGQTSPEDMMMMGLYRLNQTDKVTIETTGSERRGSTFVNLKVTAGLWYAPAEGKVKLEVMTFENGRLVSRQAADGQSLWNFDVRANTYSSLMYADENGLSNDWKQRVFRTLRLRTTGVTAFTVRILDDAYGTGLSTGRWQPWIPVSTLTRVDKSVASEAKSPGPNTTLYVLDGSDDEGWSLLGANFDQYDSTGQRLDKHYQLSVTAGELPDNVDFGFVPPRGAKVVTIDQRVGG